jgi:hypothetical protein
MFGFSSSSSGVKVKEEEEDEGHHPFKERNDEAERERSQWYLRGDPRRPVHCTHRNPRVPGTIPHRAKYRTSKDTPFGETSLLPRIIDIDIDINIDIDPEQQQLQLQLL